MIASLICRLAADSEIDRTSHIFIVPLTVQSALLSNTSTPVPFVHCFRTVSVACIIEGSQLSFLLCLVHCLFFAV